MVCVCTGKKRGGKCVHLCVHIQEQTAETEPKAERRACSMSNKLSREPETPSWSLQSAVTLTPLTGTDSADPRRSRESRPEDDETRDGEGTEKNTRWREENKNK